MEQLINVFQIKGVRKYMQIMGNLPSHSLNDEYNEQKISYSKIMNM